MCRTVRGKLHTSQFFGRETPSYDRTWEKRKVYLQSSHYFGRLRNCYKLAQRINLRALTYVSSSRKYRKKDMRDLWDIRIEGACNDMNYNAWHMRDALARTGVYLDRRVLADIAVTEPRTFRAVTAIAANKTTQAIEDGGLGLLPSGPNINIHSKL